MLISELYNADFFKTGRYAPEFSQYIMQTFEQSAPFVQAQQFVPVGSTLGTGKMGKVFDVISDEGGYSQGRQIGGSVTPTVIAGVPVTIFMSLYSEIVKMDNKINGSLGVAEKDKQLRMALARLHKTLAWTVFNADKTVVDPNGASVDALYTFDGYEKYFKVNTGQVKSAFNVADMVDNINMHYMIRNYLNGVNSLVNVNGETADVIYTTTNGSVVLQSISQDKSDYNGIYKFTTKRPTYLGVPIVTVPEAVVPEAWKSKGDFVLFANQTPDLGMNIMVSDDGALISTYRDVPNAFSKDTPIDMQFALVTANGKAAALGFLDATPTV